MQFVACGMSPGKFLNKVNQLCTTFISNNVRKIQIHDISIYLKFFSYTK